MGYVVSFSGEGNLRVVPADVSEVHSSILYEGKNPIALVTVNKSSNSKLPVQVGFQRFAAGQSVELSGHGDSKLLGLEEEASIGFASWFDGLTARAMLA